MLEGAQFSQSAGLAAASKSADELEVFVTGLDGVIRGRRFANGAWAEGWEVLFGAQFNQTAGLAAVSRADGILDVFAVGQDGLIRGCWYLLR